MVCQCPSILTPLSPASNSFLSPFYLVRNSDFHPESISISAIVRFWT